jgi:hypothetical protein
LENRVSITGLIGTPDTRGPGDGEAVSLVRATLRNEEVVVPIALVDVWALGYDFRITIPENLLLTHLPPRIEVDLEAADAARWRWLPV